MATIKPHYCDLAPSHAIHGPYHDTEYGFAVDDDGVLFERLTLEIFQAGLSWLIILKKRDAFKKAFDGFEVCKVAAYGDSDVSRLMEDAGIVRNRRKIEATIINAGRLLALQSQYGSFVTWIESHHPLSKAEWVTLFKKTFVFMGGEVVGEFLMSIGILPGAHREGCPILAEINDAQSKKARPAF